MATVTTSIGAGTGHSESVSISSVSGLGPSYTITLTAPVPSSVVVGDAFYDEAASPTKWLITGISGSDLTVYDSTGFGSQPDDVSGISSPVIERYYNGSTPITDWESELDDTDLYPSNPDAVGECYNDGAFDETFTINGGATATLNSVTLTVPEGERHDGTEGSGARLVMTSGGSICGIATPSGFNEKYTVEWLEIDLNGQDAKCINATGQQFTNVGIIQNLICHGGNGDSRPGVDSPARDLRVQNSLFYDFTRSGSTIDCISLDSDRPEGGFLNNTVYGVNNDGGTSAAFTQNTDSSNSRIRNNIVVGTTASTTALDYNFSGTSGTSSNNLSEDDSADDGGGSNHRIGSVHGQTGDDLFVSTAGGSEDLHLKTGADAIGNGVDLASTPSGVEVDADGYDRDANARGYSVTWDIGAFEFKSVTLSIGQGTGHDQSIAITASSGSGEYSVTMASAGTDVVNGDALWDEHATPRKYLIVAGAGTTSLTVVDMEGIGSAPDNSGTSLSEITRYYSGTTPLVDWESELDDTDLYQSGDNAIGRCYADATFTDSITIDGGSTVGLATLTLEAAAGEIHDGTAGTGVNINGGITVTQAAFLVSLISLEIQGSTLGIYLNQNTTNVVAHIRGNLVHDVSFHNTGTIAGIRASLGGAEILNNIVYDIANTTTGSGRSAFGIDSGNSQQRKILNNTAHNITMTGNGTACCYGFDDDADNTLQNNIGTDPSVTGTTTLEACYEQSAPVSATVNHVAASDTSASGTGSLDSITAADQFVSIVGGSEDLHLTHGADVIGAGSDLGTTTPGVEVDADGYDRDANARGYSVSWSMGAVEYKSVTLSIGSGTSHDQSIAISDSSGSGAYSVTLASAGTDVVNGDALWDEHATPRKYLIIDGAGTTSLTVVDMEGIGSAPDNSGTSLSEITRYYSGSTPITDWESELDDTNLYQENDNAFGKCYNDSAFDESVTISGGGTVGLNSVTLTVASGERHDGTEGSGARNVRTSNNDIIVIDSSIPTTVEWIELDFNGGGGDDFVEILDSHDAVVTVQRLIIHGGSDADRTRGIYQQGDNTGPFDIHNNVVYDIATTGTSGFAIAIGISIRTDYSRSANLQNNTVHDIRATNASNNNAIQGIAVTNDTSDAVVTNNIATDTVNDGTGTAEDFYFPGTNPDSDTNLSSDDTADDGGGSGHLISKTAADQFVSTASGSEDLHLKTGADAINAGTDLAATPFGVEIDADGYDRNANARGYSVAWDIGAFEYKSVTVSIGQGTGHDQNANIISATGSGEYTVTLASGGTDVVNGDALRDEHATPRKYLIVDGAGTTTLTVVDMDGVGSAPDFSATSTAEITRYYNGSTPITDWESELDDTNLYQAADNAFGVCYNDATFTELSVEFNGGGTVGLNSLTLTVAESDRHDGTAGSGVVWSHSSWQTFVKLPGANGYDVSATIEWLDLDKNGNHGLSLIQDPTSWFNHKTIRNCLVHDGLISSGSENFYGIDILEGQTDVINCIVYNIQKTTTNASQCAGIRTSVANSQQRLMNNTVHNVTHDNGSGVCYGILTVDDVDYTVQNCLVTSTGGTTSGTVADFANSSFTNSTASHNISSDSSASGTGSITSVTVADQYESIVGGSENLHLRAGADAINAGTDLSTGPYGIEIDIDGIARTGTWDIGAHNYIAPPGVLIGMATQTDTAQALTRLKTSGIGLTTETDIARTLVTSTVVSASRAAETDVALTLSSLKSAAIGLTTETDSALLLASVKSADIGRATETDSGFSLSSTKSYVAGLTTETDSALSLTSAKTAAFGTATESSQAFTLSVTKLVGVGISTETDTARTFSSLKTKTFGVTTETDEARTITVGVIGSIVRAESTEQARTLTITKEKPISRALSTESALALSSLKITTITLAEETDTANAVSSSKSAAIAVVSETDLANTLAGAIKTKQFLTSVSTDTARTMSSGKSTSISRAAETSTSFTITPMQGQLLLASIETDLAQTLNVLEPFGLVLESDTALAMIPPQDFDVGIYTMPAFGPMIVDRGFFS